MGKLKKNKAIFDSQDDERNALPNFIRWLTTSSRVTNFDALTIFNVIDEW